MSVNFEANETMKIVGKQFYFERDSREGQAALDILEGMGLPVTPERIDLLQYGIIIGKCYGKADARKARRNRA